MCTKSDSHPWLSWERWVGKRARSFLPEKMGAACDRERFCQELGEPINGGGTEGPWRQAARGSWV